MTDLEIDRALALAIGWTMTNTLPSDENPNLLQCWVWVGLKWRVFSHKDWNVVGPIAARDDCFPVKSVVGKEQWASWVNGPVTYADTPQKAIALAVIGAAKQN